MEIPLLDINNVQSSDFVRNRPNGSKDYLFVLFKSPCTVNNSGEIITAGQGCAILYEKGAEQYYRPADGTDFIHDFIHLQPETEYECKLLGSIPMGKVLYFTRPEVLTEALFRIKREKTEFGIFQKEIITNLSLNFLYKLKDALGSSKNDLWSSEIGKKLTVLREEIYSTPQKNWTVAGVCKELFISESYFKHSYKRYFGVSFLEDVISSRISTAKLLLWNTNYSVGEISQKCGYKTYEHFLRQFQKCTGMSPQKYRNKC